MYFTFTLLKVYNHGPNSSIKMKGSGITIMAIGNKALFNYSYYRTEDKRYKFKDLQLFYFLNFSNHLIP